VARQRLTVAGLDIAAAVFRRLDPSIAIETHIADGTEAQPGTRVATYRGAAAALLSVNGRPSISCRGSPELPR